MDKITLVSVLTDYEETYEIRKIRNEDKPKKESED